jgi:copper chaperone CopZ
MATAYTPTLEEYGSCSRMKEKGPKPLVKGFTKDFHAKVAELSRCKTHKRPTALFPSCCKAKEAFSCIQCSGAFFCRIHDVGRKCPVCKIPTVCKTCANKDIQALQEVQGKIRAVVAAKKAESKSWRTRDVVHPGHPPTNVLAVPEVPDNAPFIYAPRDTSKKSLQRTQKWALGRERGKFEAAAKCLKHKKS